MATSTATVEIQTDSVPLSTAKPEPNARPLPSQPTPSSSAFRGKFASGDDDESGLSAPGTSRSVNRPNRDVLVKLISSGFSFFVAGVNDGSLGALIPYVIRSYGITTAVVSVLYAATLAGWLLAAFTSTHLSQRLRLGSMLVLGAVLQTIAHALRSWPVPPFALYAVTFFLVSLGQAYQDTYANTFVASLSSSEYPSSRAGEGGITGHETTKEGNSVHRWLGFIHAMYMAGCLVAPFAAASIAATARQDRGAGKGQWWLFYSVPLGLGVVNSILVSVAFRDSLGFVSRSKESTPRPEGQQGGGRERSASSLIKDALKGRSVWLLSLFFFFYLGVVVTAGGWVVEYLVDIRSGDIAQMGYVPAGFSGGSFLGRVLLPEPTHRWGEKKMVTLYCVLCLGFQLLFWLVPNIIAASVAISLLGAAQAISVGAQLFPIEINATAISFVFVFAQVGGSVFPIITGVLGARTSVSVTQPILVGLIAAMTISWLLVPQPKGKTK
ncbi:Bypass of stop codon protein 6 [Madurella mycetomatis]|uniref:Bypass of stop codon protein 6 n=1 Tax=Madurella mycetomatis TaxID=100816 RepID=A0A175W724_9PEZI|nr:Bypass of stop codon protein 6 [Madurella mycetomatis]